MNNKMIKLKNSLEELNIKFSNEQIDKFEKYYNMLVETNKVMNLTSITELDEVIEKHFIDSLLVAKNYDMNKFSSLIDVGTGAGFPGIPIKIMFPHIKVTLLDSLNKRLKFLNSVIGELNLENIDTVHGRAEDIAQNSNYREKYELCVSRAVANLSTLSEYCIPFIKKNGIFISYKAFDSNVEINDAKCAIEKLGGEIDTIDDIKIPGSEINRKFVAIKKKNVTPKKYPRKAGTPQREPLC